MPEGCLRANGRVLAIGTPREVADRPLAAGATVTAFPDSVLIPGLVNAHTHLDLTHIGPRPFHADAGFMGWVDEIRRSRAAEPGAIRAAVTRGIELSLAGGVVAVGDIAGAPQGVPSLEPWQAIRDSALKGVSFLEFFAIGKGEERGRERTAATLDSEEIEAASGVRLGLQPHAPNTVSAESYAWACRRARSQGLPLATHLAETLEEREFVGRGRGMQRDLLERLGLWDERAAAAVGHGHSPVRHLRPVLEQNRFLLAHVNDASDEDLAILAATGQSVAYCPRASEYFGNPARLGPHRYREMLERGITVALGTDSIVNLPPSTVAPDSEGVSVLDEMRLLWTRDGVDPLLLLRMATIHGARALGLNEASFAFTVGSRLAGLVQQFVGRDGARRHDHGIVA